MTGGGISVLWRPRRSKSTSTSLTKAGHAECKWTPIALRVRAPLSGRFPGGIETYADLILGCHELLSCNRNRAITRLFLSAATVSAKHAAQLFATDL